MFIIIFLLSFVQNELAFAPIVEILEQVSRVPRQWRQPLINNGGGYVNHIIYWSTMCPAPSSATPTGSLLVDIENTFGSFSVFRERFTEEAGTLFGSGYVWLCEEAEGEGGEAW